MGIPPKPPLSPEQFRKIPPEVMEARLRLSREFRAKMAAIDARCMKWFLIGLGIIVVVLGVMAAVKLAWGVI